MFSLVPFSSLLSSLHRKKSEKSRNELENLKFKFLGVRLFVRARVASSSHFNSFLLLVVFFFRVRPTSNVLPIRWVQNCCVVAESENVEIKKGKRDIFICWTRRAGATFDVFISPATAWNKINFLFFYSNFFCSRVRINHKIMQFCFSRVCCAVAYWQCQPIIVVQTRAKTFFFAVLQLQFLLTIISAELLANYANFHF